MKTNTKKFDLEIFVLSAIMAAMVAAMIIAPFALAWLAYTSTPATSTAVEIVEAQPVDIGDMMTVTLADGRTAVAEVDQIDTVASTDGTVQVLHLDAEDDVLDGPASAQDPRAALSVFIISGLVMATLALANRDW